MNRRAPPEIVIAVQAGARVRARYDGPQDGAFVALVSEGACVAFLGVERGVPTEAVLPPGRIVARWHVLSVDVAHEGAFEAVGGATHEIAFGSAK